MRGVSGCDGCAALDALYRHGQVVGKACGQLFQSFSDFVDVGLAQDVIDLQSRQQKPVRRNEQSFVN